MGNNGCIAPRCRPDLKVFISDRKGPLQQTSSQ